jgi:hypothetical protein
MILIQQGVILPTVIFMNVIFEVSFILLSVILANVVAHGHRLNELIKVKFGQMDNSTFLGQFLKII